jgi:hypothetical protein
MAVQKSKKSCSGVLRHQRVTLSSMCRTPLPVHNEARLRLREVGVLDERAKRVQEAMDYLCKIHHLALVADRLFHPLVFISCIVEPHFAVFCCGNNVRLQVFERRGEQDCLVQPFPPRSLVGGGQPSPHKPRLVVSHSTCPPLSSSPHAHSFVLGTAVINTHTDAGDRGRPSRGRKRTVYFAFVVVSKFGLHKGLSN